MANVAPEMQAVFTEDNVTITQIIPAGPGWVAFYKTEGKGTWYTPVAAWALLDEVNEGKFVQTVAAMIVKQGESELWRADHTPDFATFGYLGSNRVQEADEAG